MRKILNNILFYLNILAGAALLLSYLSTYISPARCWVLAFFGLAYPYLLIINLLFIIYYIFRRNLKFLFSILIILLGINHLNHFLPLRIKRKFFDKEVKEGRNDLKILSFNVHAFEWYSNPESFKAMVNLIQSERPDIICLQEFYLNSGQKSGRDIILKLFNNTPYNHIHYSHSFTKSSAYGIATFSKFPVTGKGSINFEKTFNDIIYTDLLINDDTVRIYNNHLQSVYFHKKNYAFLDTLKLTYDEESMKEIMDISRKLKAGYVKRSHQVDVISSHIADCPYPVIVCGDFNDTPVSYTYRKMRAGLKDAFLSSGRGAGNTYTGIFPSFRIDYILCSDELSPLLFEIVEAKLSDHYPILCTLDLNE